MAKKKIKKMIEIVTMYAKYERDEQETKASSIRQDWGKVFDIF